MINEFMQKHNVSQKKLILDVQGFGFLRECYPQARCFSGASTASQRSKNQYRTAKDEAGHVAMEMIQNGLIHYEPRLAQMHYMHKNMKRQGGTTILRHMIFESRIFQFYKTPNGRNAMIDKERMKQMLKGMSPDLTDNVILLCGGTIYDCYRILRDDAGMSRKKAEASDMLALLNINGVDDVDTRITRARQKIRNANEILNILSTI